MLLGQLQEALHPSKKRVVVALNRPSGFWLLSSPSSTASVSASGSAACSSPPPPLLVLVGSPPSGLRTHCQYLKKNEKKKRQNKESARGPRVNPEPWQIHAQSMRGGGKRGGARAQAFTIRCHARSKSLGLHTARKRRPCCNHRSSCLHTEPTARPPSR